MTLENGYLVLNNLTVRGANTYGIWGSPNELAFQVLVKPAGAPYWTYALDNVEVGSNPGAQAPGTDVQLTELFPVDQNFNIAGTPSFEDFVNGVNPTYQFAPIFLTDTMVLPVRELIRRR